ncbi:MAG: thioredoxin-like domain-containing protein, partial [Tissierellia bacterium]|nr:thioredoxin-like domain-containing protein [Tissierellia bacterium]
TILAFYKNNCENCDEEFEALKKINEEFDINLIFVNTMDEKKDFEESIEQYELKDQKLIRDPYGKLAGKFLVQAVPKIVFLNKEGLYKGATEESKTYEQLNEMVKRVDNYKNE